jgi:hypothetical protein
MSFLPHSLAGLGHEDVALTVDDYDANKVSVTFN